MPLFAQQAIPTPDEFLGYKLGEEFTQYDRILAYFDELTKRSNLITTETFGKTYEGRPLVLATIANAKNRADRSNAVVIWLAFGVHGNESSSAEAAMQVASALLREPALLENAIVLIDPLQNPDGRERYVTWFKRSRGIQANTNPDALEHNEPWPGGRYNHYLIDMNRDWTWMSQRETQARVAIYMKWKPNVLVDFHEMSYRSNYFFPPDAKPVNANLHADVEKWLEVFGRANAQEFNRRGWQYFVGENFDLFYPGYGDSWPSLHGAIGMTYEMAGGGRAGSAIEREDGSTLTLRDRIDRHFTTAMITVRTAVANREQLIDHTNAALRTAEENGKQTFLLAPGSPEFPRLVEMLQKQGVVVSMLNGSTSMRVTRIDREAAETRTFPAGTAVISTKQPYGGLVQTLLERNATFSKGYLEEQRVRADADEPDEFYDMTSWSLPLAMNVEAFVTTANVSAVPYAAPAPRAFAPASYGYLVSATDPGLYRFLGLALRRNVRFSVADAELSFGEQSWPRGSVIILKSNNAATLDETLAAAARDAGVTLQPLEAGWIGKTSFGSEKIRFVKEPKIALVGGQGTGASSFGMLWHTLDTDTPIPHTVVALDSIRTLDLARYNVLVFPDGSYTDRMAKREIEKLQAWLRAGGTVVAVKGASSFLRNKDNAISKLRAWNETKDEKKDEDDETGGRYNEFRVPGSAFRTSINERSYLTFGVPRPPAVLIEGSSAFQPVAHRVDNIVTIAKEDPLVSGVAWDESLERLRGSVYMTSEPYGRGNVITFADDPHFRLFWRGTLPLFLNAVIYSPSYPR